MLETTIKEQFLNDYILISAGSNYMDIDAYACCVATEELLRLKGYNAISYSCAPINYSVSESLTVDSHVNRNLPDDCDLKEAKYIIVDVSDPNYLSRSIPLENVVEVFDHHAGFENYWMNRIGENAHIEFIGAAATMIYREWKAEKLHNRMKVSTALLLIAAILDNTLNLTSQNTTDEDIMALEELCAFSNVDESWCEKYFLEVQENIEKDLKNALFYDLKSLEQNDVLPSNISQLCVWDAQSVLDRIIESREWFNFNWDNWMINIIDMKHRCSYFVCDDVRYQTEIERLFNVRFGSNIAKSEVSYLRKEIIKKAYYSD